MGSRLSKTRANHQCLPFSFTQRKHRKKKRTKKSSEENNHNNFLESTEENQRVEKSFVTSSQMDSTLRNCSEITSCAAANSPPIDEQNRPDGSSDKTRKSTLTDVECEELNMDEEFEVPDSPESSLTKPQPTQQEEEISDIFVDANKPPSHRPSIPLLRRLRSTTSQGGIVALRGRSMSQRVSTQFDDPDAVSNRLSEMNALMQNVSSIKLALLQLKRLLNEDCTSSSDMLALQQSLSENNSPQSLRLTAYCHSANPLSKTKTFFSRECYLDELHNSDMLMNLKRLNNENSQLMDMIAKKDARLAQLEKELADRDPIA